ncbi:hypothetical protein Q5424_03785 [Conexibacter sp. JD483]|uniref:hypothetical protein n=1 Tax=unclassified Conexibacter TaxID=2627773 RepID=UPI00271C6B79|nr:MULTISPECIES: hypothetical protein [unclassified Conexibacter]MDO8186211.1 hypothetical protein [Conexibacter sp. CPCC 205706]MDO8199722.1 hypothetical protein [Conexibacter sp. CPCC 205762]MDR9368186.1 hypothetical protein [Conexibacter sp. JD483]
MIRLAALLAVATLAVAPAAATAQALNDPLSPLQGQQQAPISPQPNQPPAPAPVENRDDGDGSGPGVAIAIAVITVALIGGIWFAITRDARQHAPKRNRRHTARTDPTAEELATPGSRGRHRTRAAPRTTRRHSKQEQKRRKRGRAR